MDFWNRARTFAHEAAKKSQELRHTHLSPPPPTRTKALHWLTIAEKLLSARDLMGSKSFATRARDSDPTLSPADQILRLTPQQVCESEVIAGQYHNLPWKLRQRSSKEVRKRVSVCMSARRPPASTTTRREPSVKPKPSPKAAATKEKKAATAKAKPKDKAAPAKTRKAAAAPAKKAPVAKKVVPESAKETVEKKKEDKDRNLKATPSMNRLMNSSPSTISFSISS